MNIYTAVGEVPQSCNLLEQRNCTSSTQCFRNVFLLLFFSFLFQIFKKNFTMNFDEHNSYTMQLLSMVYYTIKIKLNKPNVFFTLARMPVNILCIICNTQCAANCETKRIALFKKRNKTNCDL